MRRFLVVCAIALLALSGCAEQEERFNQLTADTAAQVVQAYAERCLRQMKLDDNPTFFRRGFEYSATFDGFAKDPTSQEVQERWTVVGPGLEAIPGGGRHVVPGTWRVVAGQRDPTPLSAAAVLYNQTVVELAYGTASRPSGCS